MAPAHTARRALARHLGRYDEAAEQEERAPCAGERVYERGVRVPLAHGRIRTCIAVGRSGWAARRSRASQVLALLSRKRGRFFGCCGRRGGDVAVRRTVQPQ